MINRKLFAGIVVLIMVMSMFLSGCTISGKATATGSGWRESTRDSTTQYYEYVDVNGNVIISKARSIRGNKYSTYLPSPSLHGTTVPGLRSDVMLATAEENTYDSDGNHLSRTFVDNSVTTSGEPSSSGSFAVVNSENPDVINVYRKNADGTPEKIAYVSYPGSVLDIPRKDIISTVGGYEASYTTSRDDPLRYYDPDGEWVTARYTDHGDGLPHPTTYSFDADDTSGDDADDDTPADDSEAQSRNVHDAEAQLRELESLLADEEDSADDDDTPDDTPDDDDTTTDTTEHQDGEVDGETGNIWYGGELWEPYVGEPNIDGMSWDGDSWEYLTYGDLDENDNIWVPGTGFVEPFEGETNIYDEVFEGGEWITIEDDDTEDDDWITPVDDREAQLRELESLLADEDDSPADANPPADGTLDEQISGLINKIGAGTDSEDVLAESSALDELIGIGEPAVPALIVALNGDDVYVRSKAAGLLGRIDSPDAVQPLIQALRDSNAGVRIAAILSLGNLGSTEVVQPIILALSDSNEYVKYKAVIVLGNLGNQEALIKLRELQASDTDEFVRNLARDAISKIENTNSNDGEQSGDEAGGGNRQDTSSDTEINSLISNLGSDNPDTLRQAMNLLIAKGESAVPALTTALRSNENALVKRQILRSLDQIGSESAVLAIMSAVTDDDVKDTATNLLIMKGYSLDDISRTSPSFRYQLQEGEPEPVVNPDRSKITMGYQRGDRWVATERMKVHGGYLKRSSNGLGWSVVTDSEEIDKLKSIENIYGAVNPWENKYIIPNDKHQPVLSVYTPGVVGYINAKVVIGQGAVTSEHYEHVGGGKWMQTDFFSRKKEAPEWITGLLNVIRTDGDYESKLAEYGGRRSAGTAFAAQRAAAPEQNQNILSKITGGIGNFIGGAVKGVGKGIAWIWDNSVGLLLGEPEPVIDPDLQPRDISDLDAVDDGSGAAPVAESPLTGELGTQSVTRYTTTSWAESGDEEKNFRMTAWQGVGLDEAYIRQFVGDGAAQDFVSFLDSNPLSTLATPLKFTVQRESILDNGNTLIISTADYGDRTITAIQEIILDGETRSVIVDPNSELIMGDANEINRLIDLAFSEERYSVDGPNLPDDVLSGEADLVAQSNIVRANNPKPKLEARRTILENELQELEDEDRTKRINELIAKRSQDTITPEQATELQKLLREDIPAMEVRKEIAEIDEIIDYIDNNKPILAVAEMKDGVIKLVTPVVGGVYKAGKYILVDLIGKKVMGTLVWDPIAAIPATVTTIAGTAMDLSEFIIPFFWGEKDTDLLHLLAEGWADSDGLSLKSLDFGSYTTKKKYDPAQLKSAAYDMTWDLAWSMFAEEKVDEYVKEKCKDDTEQSHPADDTPENPSGDQNTCTGSNIYNAQFISVSEPTDEGYYIYTYSFGISACEHEVKDYNVILYGEVDGEAISESVFLATDRNNGNLDLGKSISKGNPESNNPWTAQSRVGGYTRIYILFSDGTVYRPG
jgi:HEAT repeat protein